MTFCAPQDPLALVTPLIAFLVLDHLYPRHKGILYKVHPVRLAYYAAIRLAKPHAGVSWGVLVWLLIVITIVAPVAGVLCILSQKPLAWVIAATITIKFSAAFKLLADTVEGIAKTLDRGDLEEARRLAGEIVRRPTRELSEWQIASAAIESLAENLVDGLTSPLTYYPLLGPPGALLQRVANTLDGAIGYRTPEYERVGKPAAHIDTLLNLAPARTTALLIALLAPIAGGSMRGALKAWAQWRTATPSVNAGHPIAAMAGALGVKLEKPGTYTINPQGRPPTPSDIRRALRIARAVTLAYMLGVLAIILILYNR